MIVCSCNVISHREIHKAVEDLHRQDPNVVLTPGKIYRCIGCRPKCGNCLKHFCELMHAHRRAIEGERG
ncbi:MAG: hypothetical protein Kow0032_04730 [Methyloligellaceae bacterium]